MQKWQRKTNNSLRIAQVYLNQSNKRLDIPYDYTIPEELQDQIKPGIRVAVYFGKGNRLIEGFVVGLRDHTDFKGTLRPVQRAIDSEPIVTPEQLNLCQWMTQTYVSLFYETLALFTHPVKVSLHPGRSQKESAEHLVAYADCEKVYTLTALGEQAETKGKVMRQILALLAHRDYTESEMNHLLGSVAASRRNLLQKGWISVSEKAIEASSRVGATGSDVRLTDEEEKTYQHYLKLKKPGSPAFFYWKNRTSQFRLYLKLAQRVCRQGRSAVIILPEVDLSLKYQELFYNTFGDQGGIYHGRLKQKERYHLFEKVRRGQIQVVLGSRAALFLPFLNLSLIVVDEEMDASYYSPSNPHFNVRDVAGKYAKICGAELIVSDQLPSVEAYQAIHTGRMVAFGKWNPLVFPALELVDMQAEIKSGHLDFISRRLGDAIEQTLDHGQRSLLMLNRLGYDTYVFCRDCGYVERCPDCQVAMKTTRQGILRCPYCGREKRLPRHCPQCGSPRFRPMGLGLDRAVEVLKKRYKGIGILKIDARAIADSGGFSKMNKIIGQNNHSIIVGTRAMVRAFDYGNVGLSAALLIDGDLNNNHYDSAQRMTQLYSRFFALSQGKALAQTYEPENETLLGLACGNVRLYYSGELNYRKALGYPPFGHLFFFTVFGNQAAQVKKDCWQLYHLFLSQRGQEEWMVYKPSATGVRPGTGETQWQLVIKTKEKKKLSEAMGQLIRKGAIEKLPSKVAMAMDPVMG
ncbi:MAG: primosomal protein N' [Eubacteriaceae bacterium]|nr:primosomal protein N' [Eubacteriaceae bacterium]